MSEGEGLGERLLSISLSSAVFTPFTGPRVIDRQTKEKQADSDPPLGASAKGITPDIIQSPKLSLTTCN